MTVLYWIILILFSYTYGSVNNAIIISNLIFHKDIRTIGSGNPGSMNMFRSFGIGGGLLTLVLDGLKGAIPSLLGWFILGQQFAFGSDRIGLYVCAVFVLIGHIFPVFYKFKGGKGVASSIGICFVMNPLVTAISFVAGVLLLIVTKYGFITSFIILGAPCIYESVVEFSRGNVFYGIVILLIYAAVIFMHRGNIARFVKGKENKTVLFGRKKAGIEPTPYKDDKATEDEDPRDKAE